MHNVDVAQGEADWPSAAAGEEWLRRARQGDLAGAWEISDRIRARRGPGVDWRTPRHQQQIWNGEKLDGQRVLIRCYHGLGDTLQFVRYAPLVAGVARRVILWAQPALLPLLETVRGVDELLPLHDGAPDVAYDTDVEIMELPYAFRTTLNTVPASVPYLHAPARPLAGPRPHIGVVWRGGAWDPRRAVPFNVLTMLFEREVGTWHRLQCDALASETHPRLRHLRPCSIAEYAGYVAGLDLLISVDTMAAHLAGALGIPVWTLLVSDADWRWMEGRSDSPWYPTMRLFRQPRPDDCAAVVEQVRAALATDLIPEA